MNNETHKNRLSFNDLMKFRVRDILIVSTEYDGFVLEEDGRLSEKIYNEYYDLSIHYVPRIKRVLNAEAAFAALEKIHYDLVITMSHIGVMNVYEFSSKVKETYPDLTIIMLSYERITLQIIKKVREEKSIDRIFHWSGESSILTAILKYVEDKKNYMEDCRQGVQVILVVEDSPLYYSQFLSIIYREIMKQARYLVVHAENMANKLLRVRARPKIILAETYEEAMEAIYLHKDNLLGVITDSVFPRNGKADDSACFDLLKNIKELDPYMPVLVQSDNQKNRQKAESMGASYLDKNSPNLLYDIRKSVLEDYGFGEFVFRYETGEEIGRASDIDEFIQQVRIIPAESLSYHGRNNHFSRWFRARTAFEIANELRTIDIRDYDNLEEIREIVLNKIISYLNRNREGEILDFDSSKIDIDNVFLKIGSGSLGGKARGIAFLNHLVKENNLRNKYEDIKVLTPSTFVICSDEYEKFVESNNIYEFALTTDDESEIAKKFLVSELSEKLQNDLKRIIDTISKPLAIRSSSILEDSQTLPFAGIFNTYIIPNNDDDEDIRYKQLYDSVRLVYSSVFYKSPKQYAKNADIRIEEEKMAVIIQELVGREYDGYFYPQMSGVAQSYNFYPYTNIQPKDGTVSLALGFGRIIVEGGEVYRYSPAYPKKPPPFSGAGEFLKKLQNSFYALNLHNSKKYEHLQISEDSCYDELPLTSALEHGSLKYIASTYSAENDRIIDNVNLHGPKIITFAPVIKHNRVKINDIIKDILSLGKRAFGCDVEIEFAVNFPEDEEKAKEFYFLQVRPMVVGKESTQTNILDDEKEKACVVSKRTIGNGVYDNIYDIIYIDPRKFDIKDTQLIAKEIEQLNKILYEEDRKCILIGFGRMGTFDRWLGIPLTWSQMSQARVVIEHELEALQAEPSLGSHFYHNLTSLSMGYLHIGYKHKEDDMIRWNLLDNEAVYKQTERVKLIRSEKPFIVKIDGVTSKGVIYKLK